MKTHLIALALAVAMTGCQSKEEAKQQSALPVAVETVSETSTLAPRSYVGQVEEQQSTILSFTGTGAIKQMLVDEGQQVKRGQLIAVMDEEQMQNTLSNAKAQLAQAQDAYDRLKIVHDAGSLPEQQWVEMQSKLQQAKSTEAMARKMLADCRIMAPVSGVVGTVYLRAGETALPSQPVCTVLDISSVKVKVAVPEAEISDISANTPSLISVSAAKVEGIQGGTIEKGVQADAITRTYNIKINVDNAQRTLLPGMVAKVELQTGRQEHPALTLPIMAVQQNADGSKFVWVVKNGKAQRQQVELGEMSGNRITIVSGLSKGDKVITEGYQKVSEGEVVSF